jgi:hypothetical protein
MQKVQQLKKHKILGRIILLATILFSACTKIDIQQNERAENKVEITNRFFKVSPQTDKLTYLAINEIKRRNFEKEFVSTFATNIGYPVWGKALITTINRVGTSESFANNSIVIDTLLYIPFVKEDSNSINGYILAKVNTNVALSYTLAQDYKACSFVIQPNDLNDASKLALIMMYLNKSVFNVSNYKITDTRLFSEDTINKKIISINLDNTLSTQKNFVSSLNCSITFTNTTTCGGRNVTTTASNMHNPCTTTTTTTVFCDYEPPGGGGGSGGSGGGGGGGGCGACNGIPPAFPCNPNPDPSFTGQSNTGTSSIAAPIGSLPPCPPSGSGWAPFQSLCSNSLNFIQGNDNSYWETYVTDLRFETGPNQINSYNAYFALGNDITDYKMNEVIFPSPFGPGVPPKTPLEYLHDFFPSLTQQGSVDIYKIWDPTIQSYVWRFSKLAVQVISSRCSNLASIDVSLQYYGTASTPGFIPAQNAFRAKTSAFLKCFSPTIGTTCRLIPSTSANLSTASYSIGCL